MAAITATVMAFGCSNIERDIPAPERELELTSHSISNGPDACLQVTHDIFCGSTPDAEGAFAALSNLGVRTIVSVDGEIPNTALARKFGMTYVHIPFGYDGLDSRSELSIIRVTNELNGPYYFHCHHGKHRGPTAAAIAAMAAGELNNDQATIVLSEAGTDRRYAGLWQAVERFQTPTDVADWPELKETVQIKSCGLFMAKIDRFFERLIERQQNRWQEFNNGEVSSADQDSILLLQLFRETNRLHSGSYQAPFKQWLRESETDAKKLSESIREKQWDVADQLLNAIGESCVECHRTFRDKSPN